MPVYNNASKFKQADGQSKPISFAHISLGRICVYLSFEYTDTLILAPVYECVR